MTTRKPRRPNNLHLLDGQQREALGKFQKDLQQALPHMQGMAKTAMTLHQAIIDAPVLRVVDTPKPEGVPEPELWSVGHAKVNYVEHIEHEGTQDK